MEHADPTPAYTGVQIRPAQFEQVQALLDSPAANTQYEYRVMCSQLLSTLIEYEQRNGELKAQEPIDKEIEQKRRDGLDHVKATFGMHDLADLRQRILNRTIADPDFIMLALINTAREHEKMVATAQEHADGYYRTALAHEEQYKKKLADAKAVTSWLHNKILADAMEQLRPGSTSIDPVLSLGDQAHLSKTNAWIRGVDQDGRPGCEVPPMDDSMYTADSVPLTDDHSIETCKSKFANTRIEDEFAGGVDYEHFTEPQPESTADTIARHHGLINLDTSCVKELVDGLKKAQDEMYVAIKEGRLTPRGEVQIMKACSAIDELLKQGCVATGEAWPKAEQDPV